MKLLILSNLHLEFGVPLDLPGNLEYDVVVLTGDIHSPGNKGVEWGRSALT